MNRHPAYMNTPNLYMNGECLNCDFNMIFLMTMIFLISNF
jgi:hypothetical protein